MQPPFLPGRVVCACWCICVRRYTAITCAAIQYYNCSPTHLPGYEEERELLFAICGCCSGRADGKHAKEEEEAVWLTAFEATLFTLTNDSGRVTQTVCGRVPARTIAVPVIYPLTTTKKKKKKKKKKKEHPLLDGCILPAGSALNMGAKTVGYAGVYLLPLLLSVIDNVSGSRNSWDKFLVA